MKKVLIITYYWPPSGGAGVQRWLKFAKYLPKFGINPVILTVDEKSASYAQLDHSLMQEISPDLEVHRTTTFEPYNFYRKISGKKEIPYGGFSNQKKVTLIEKISRFIRGNFFIPDSRRGWNSYAFKKAAELIKAGGIDAVITSGPPHSTHLIGKKLKQKTGIRWVADFRDPWTDIYYYNELFHAAPAAAYDKYLESSVLNKADKIITVSHDVARMLREKLKYEFDKIAVIPNGFDEEDFKTKDAVSNAGFTITYTGTIASNYRIEKFIEALQLLPEERINQLTIRFVGNVPDEVIARFAQNEFTGKVEVMGYVPHEMAIRYMMGASLLLLAIPDTNDNKGIVTGKFFEYLATGKPILALGPVDGDVDKILTDCCAGRLFAYDDITGMKTYLEELLERYQKGTNTTQHTGIEAYTRKNLTAALSRQL